MTKTILETPKSLHLHHALAFSLHQIFLKLFKLLNLIPAPTEILIDRTETRQGSWLKIVKIPQFRAEAGSFYAKIFLFKKYHRYCLLSKQ